MEYRNGLSVCVTLFVFILVSHTFEKFKYIVDATYERASLWPSFCVFMNRVEIKLKAFIFKIALFESLNIYLKEIRGNKNIPRTLLTNHRRKRENFI